MGVCYQLVLHEVEQYMETNPFTQTNCVLGLILSINMSDTTYGWHGYRKGCPLSDLGVLNRIIRFNFLNKVKCQ